MQVSESALSEFFSECDEILQRFSNVLSKVEKNQTALSQLELQECIGSLYRDMHTLKGSSQLFGFQLVGQIAHAMEASLEPIRRLNLMIPQVLIDALFRCIDLIDRILKQSMQIKSEERNLFLAEVKMLVPKLLDEATACFDASLRVQRDSLNVSEGNQEFFIKSKQTPDTVTKITDVRMTEQNPGEKKVSSSPSVAGTPLNTSSKAVTDATPAPAQVSAAVPAPAPIASVVSQSSSAAGSVNEPAPAAAAPNSAASDATSTVRIQVGLLDKLMNLVGEMVLVRNQVLQYSQKNDDLAFLNLSQRLDLVTSELQGEVMKTRMQPIGSILSKFQRVVRDLGKDLGKQIELITVGTETELDKTIIEAIKDPLTHIIRNSCDHGIESTEERIKNGKSAIGHVTIKAYHEGGQVIIEISDDGKGLNYKRILEKAIEKKVISADAAKNLSDREIGYLIFAPGFSTAEQVSAVSGRGVGMDVVKTNLEKVGGQVELQSEFQKGMTIRMRIPLTLAIVPALIIKSGDEQFAIPQVKLAELVRVEKDGTGPKIEYLQGKPMFRLRGRLLSLVSLREVLKLGSSSESDPLTNSDSINIVVLNGEGDTFGLVVDEIRDTADIVVKPLSQFLKRISAYSGATIMGDGTVSLILDITGLAQKVNLFQKSAKKEFSSESGLQSKDQMLSQEYQDFLFFRLDSNESYCLPLCLVNRLEEFSADSIEYSGAQKIVQYRGTILPLFSLNAFLQLNTSTEANKNNERLKTSAIVIQKAGKFYGIEVNEVVDIASVKTNIEDPIKPTPGILGSIIVNEDVSTVIDVLGILNRLIGIPDSVNKGNHQALSASESKPNVSDPETAPIDATVLFAEDTVFFMKQVKRVLESQGLSVVHAINGEEAWQMLESTPTRFQLILTDIEMPKMTGFELAEKVKGDERFKKLPMIALTTKFRDVDRENGKKVGFTYYLEKLKSDQLIEVLRSLLKEYIKK